MVVYYIKACSYRWFMVNIAVDNFQPGELQLISSINTIDNSQHGGAISDIQSGDWS